MDLWKADETNVDEPIKLKIVSIIKLLNDPGTHIKRFDLLVPNM